MNKKNKAEFLKYNFWSKIAIYLSQATGEVFSPQKRTSSTSKNEIFSHCSIFVGISALLIPVESVRYPDPTLAKIKPTIVEQLQSEKSVKGLCNR
jgi:hypothetical protein